jgi:flagellin
MTMSVINTNVKSLVAQNAMTVNNRSLGKVMEQLSTGKRINSAADDAAGLAISDKMTSQIRGLNQAVRNANDGISMLQTAEGATQEVTNMLQRMRELAVQASNDTYSSADRSALQLENDALSAEITRISNNTQWNNMYVFKTSASAAVGTSGLVQFQVGVNGTSSDLISAQFSAIDASTLSASALDLTTQSGAQSAIGVLDSAIATVDTMRAGFGSKINRLTYAADNLTNIAQNTSASRSRIMDTDYAAATTDLAKSQIIQQAATAMLAQANQQPQSVLSLLK